MIILRYIFKELYTHILGIMLVLLIIFITNQFVHYLQLVANGQLTMPAVMKIMSLQVPLLIGYLLPLSLYLAILLVFGRLYMDHEMTVLSACGVSKAKLMSIALMFGLLVTLVVGWLMIWVEPILESYRIQVVEDVIKSGAMEAVLPRQFQSIGNYGVFYTNKVDREKGHMKNIFLAFRNPKHLEQWDVTIARSAQEQINSKSDIPFLLLQNGYRYLGQAGDKNFQVMQFDNYGLHFKNPVLHLSSELEKEKIGELWSKRKTNPKASAMIQWRFAMPISVMILVLLAVPLSHTNPRFGRFARLFPAIVIYTVYADLLFLGRAWIEKGTINPTLGMWWIHGTLLLLALILVAFELNIISLQKIKWVGGKFRVYNNASA